MISKGPGDPLKVSDRTQTGGFIELGHALDDRRHSFHIPNKNVKDRI